jgi:glutamate--cysteine ligase
VYSGEENSNHVKDFKPDLIVSNNDFSDPKNEWASTLSLPMNPPRGLGWYQRRKDLFFKFYNQLTEEFAEIIKIDPFFLKVKTELFSPFDINDDQMINDAAEKIESMITNLQIDYIKHDIPTKPFIFVKNNSGTYGLGVIKVESGEEFKRLNYKSRKKMKAAKGGKEVQEVIIQEGIPSIVRADGATAEPVIYMIGCHLAGGFLRTHSEKSEKESLNSPGAIYKRLCVSDLDIDATACPNENVYGWTAKLALLAIGMEADEMKVEYSNFKKARCSNDHYTT